MSLAFFNTNGAPYYSFPVPGGAATPLPSVQAPISITNTTQVAGLVPVFPCINTECREGRFGADTIKDDTQFPLNVYAQMNGDGTDLYSNDRSSWLFELSNVGTGSTITFLLDKLVGNIWVNQATLNNNNFGVFSPKPPAASLCLYKSWTGYQLYWQKVLLAYGAGMYRFRTSQILYEVTTCFASPPFCLHEFDCFKVDKSTKFETIYNGGKIGNINKKLVGSSWSFCCTNPSGVSTPIQWYDSIRIPGFFGREEKSKERNNIKYQTGLVVRVRDESISKFIWKSFGSSAANLGSGLPFWFHDRFSVYGLMADQLFASDYNLNNSDYNLKRYPVMDDSDYSPAYKGNSRYSNVEVKFKSATQYVIRTRCC